ncbi:uncharacterized protein SPSK_06295 [Sporothrix schenckii 1099-18]|uniref:Integral membrane protein n=1 Tax=Sporothrix schenckii 1099-18 TaxID=1397361 RepID=A0A0F2MMI9_SPOSC|nr:uncharacterized protein SPSK_06295 [Sporothrix schenckii 1099-18]KJR90040.1 integral membrane protein [Sporothrix schenckii 1099-18]
MSNIDHSRDGESKVTEIIAIITVSCALTSTLVVLRVVTRTFIVRAFGPDDWVLVVAQVLAIAAAVAIGLEQHFGMGRHVWTIEDLVPYTKSFYSSILVYNAALVLVKVSIVLMYRRIFVGTWLQRANLAALVFLTAWGIALVSFLSMLCLPIQLLWDPTVKGHCIDFVPAFFAPAVINLITDLTVFILPLPAIRQLQLPLRQKIILAFILCLGLFTCIISIVRLSTLDAAATSSDTTWDNTGAALWSYLELTVAIIAACLPTLRPFVSRFFPRLISSGGSNDQHSAPPTGPDGPLQTWGGSGGPTSSTPSGQYSKVSDSTDALYADAEIGMDVLAPVDKPQPVVQTTVQHTYRESVARRGRNETTIGTGRSPRSQGSDEVELTGQGYGHGNGNTNTNSGIRATTTIKQEYQ